MNLKHTFDTESVLRDLAEQYLKGSFSTDEYLDAIEETLRQHAASQNPQFSIQNEK